MTCLPTLKRQYAGNRMKCGSGFRLLKQEKEKEDEKKKQPTKEELNPASRAEPEVPEDEGFNRQIIA